MRILGIDPGVSATGLVVMELESETVLAANTVTTKRGDDSFENMVERVEIVATRILLFCELFLPDVIATESFEDITPLRRASRRYYTPFLLGYLHRAFLLAGKTPIYQSPKEKAAWKDYKAVWSGKIKGSKVFKGDELLTNEHLRDAAIHCLIYRAGESAWSG